jgi:hypothetical protein
MSRDTQRSVVPMAPSIMKAKPTDRQFLVPFRIEGERAVWAADLEGAQRLAEQGDKMEWAEYGELETFDPEPVQ